MRFFTRIDHFVPYKVVEIIYTNLLFLTTGTNLFDRNDVSCASCIRRKTNFNQNDFIISDLTSRFSLQCFAYIRSPFFFFESLDAFHQLSRIWYMLTLINSSVKTQMTTQVNEQIYTARMKCR